MKIIDMHCDTISALRSIKSHESDAPDTLLKNRLQIDLPRMKQSGYLLQNFALYVNLKEETDPCEAALFMTDLFYKEIEKYPDLIRPVTSYTQIKENMQSNRVSALLTLEEGEICKGSLSHLRNFYRLGVRMMTLTWNYNNQLGAPNFFPGYKTDKKDLKSQSENSIPTSGLANPAGLTKKGLEFLSEMEQLGIIIDVSHLSDGGFYDVYHHTLRPFVASHSNARALCPNCRNLTDDMIQKIGERGGVIGLNYYGNFLTENPNGDNDKSTVQSIARHAKHIANIGGISCLGLGSDFDGFDGEAELYDCSTLSLLADALKQSGFTSSDIDRICYKNVLDFYKEML
ncbi:MAG: dipeptidase [Lachnospiraceae bacterium]|nr:dipeptidase [Lachnospiraceae bacterium]